MSNDFGHTILAGYTMDPNSRKDCHPLSGYSKWKTALCRRGKKETVTRTRLGNQSVVDRHKNLQRPRKRTRSATSSMGEKEVKEMGESRIFGEDEDVSDSQKSRADILRKGNSSMSPRITKFFTDNVRGKYRRSIRHDKSNSTRTKTKLMRKS